MVSNYPSDDDFIDWLDENYVDLIRRWTSKNDKTKDFDKYCSEEYEELQQCYEDTQMESQREEAAIDAWERKNEN